MRAIWFHCIATLVLAILPASAENAPLNAPCNPSLSRLDPATHKMLSDCDDKFFCNTNTGGNATCSWKGCQQFDHDIAWNATEGDTVPTFCPAGSYCPDMQNGCQPVLPLGARCELDRDDECAPGPNPSDVTICLQFQCQLANLLKAQTCTISDTQYSSTFLNRTFGTVLVSRDNCKRPEFYCDRSSLVCVDVLPLDATCNEDRDCASVCEPAARRTTESDCSDCTLTQATCHPSKRACIRAPQDPIPISPIAISLTATILVSTISTVVWSLVWMHNRQRDKRRREREAYYREQMTFRNSIMDLHALSGAKRW